MEGRVMEGRGVCVCVMEVLEKMIGRWRGDGSLGKKKGWEIVRIHLLAHT